MKERPATMAQERYDGATLALHWVTAALVLALFALAETWGFLPRGPLRHSLQGLHMSLGLALMAIVLLRLPWRAGFARRLPPAESGLAGAAAEATHGLLYLLLIVLICSGPVRHWTQGQPLPFFGLLSVPAPIAMPAAWHKPASLVHVWAAWAIIGLAALHAAAALFHHYMLRDGVLRRMMPAPRT